MALAILFISFILSALATAVVIPILRRLKFGQAILQIGPSWHNKKSGTPTMGGIGFIVSLVIIVFVVMGFDLYEFSISDISILVFAFAFGAVGFLDDFIKVVLKQNQGLKSLQKFILQLIVAGVGICFLYFSGNITTEIIIPFTSMTWDLGIWYIPFMIFVILAIVNAVNLTDGLDGLAGTVTVIVVFAFALMARRMGFDGSYAIAIATIGVLLGFLIFNVNPAKVFMGDTGSLFLGGLVAFFVVRFNNPFIILLIGIIYFIETLSVILQVGYFRLTRGKRLFLMTPIHHHFEKLGWGEKKVVVIFSVVTMVGCLIAMFS